MTCLIPLAALEDSVAPESDPIWRLAVREASKSTMSYKLGAVLVRRGKVLAVGRNVNKTHPDFGSGHFKTMHAEGNCLYNAKKRGIDPSGCTLIVYRKNNNLSKPCSCCMVMIKKFGIEKVVYS